MLPTYLPNYLTTYLPTYIHTYIHTYTPTYLHMLPTYVPTYIRTYLHTYLPTYLLTCELFEITFMLPKWIGPSIYFKWARPFISAFTEKLYQESNQDHRSRRQACYPRDQDHGPKGKIIFATDQAGN